MKKLKAFWEEFKKFISRGNVVDMAIGVIVASSFTAIVTALTNKIIMPLINWLLSLGGANGLESAYTFLNKVYTVDSEGNAIVDLTKSIYIDWGAFITAILNFFLVAFILFSLLKVFNAATKFTKDMNNKIISLSKKEIKKLKKQGLSNEEIKKIEEQKVKEQAENQKVEEQKNQEKLLENNVENQENSSQQQTSANSENSTNQEKTEISQNPKTEVSDGSKTSGNQATENNSSNKQETKKPTTNELLESILLELKKQNTSQILSEKSKEKVEENNTKN